MGGLRIVAGRQRRDQRGMVTVVAREWAIGLHTPHSGVGVSYRHPTRVLDSAGRSRRILDHVMLARVAGAAVLALAVTIRRFRR